ncbi:hypothetical protein DFR65_101367 [Oceanihabitans sediminis]|uniref:Uncharacterized protein n=1 Tax=Oceanihabitans sediminis TaxID=1812012 RepID=A0A368P7Q9_9FLAO|nr:hypothetical protein DFR65_101367 [Oceanihabitans sediminis]RCU58144.1 hypothetical protein DU428_01815 [Oceanihabitans sediminis]
MNTGNIQFKRATYLQTGTNQKRTTIDYETKFNNDPLFSKTIRLELDNGFHDRSRYFDYWLYFKYDKWYNSAKTGLANTNIKNVFEGNITRELNLTTKNHKGRNFETPQHLVIIQSTNICKSLTIDIFKDFYICKKEILKHFIVDHIKKHNIIKKEPLDSSLICSNVRNNGQR